MGVSRHPVPEPTHGFAIAARLKPNGDVGTGLVVVTSAHLSLARPARTTRLHPTVGEEPGIAGGNRTILAATRTGRAQLRKWLATPVVHLRDLRSELLLKLIIAEICDIDIDSMLDKQHAHIASLAEVITTHLEAQPDDVVALWRRESSSAALRFLERLPNRIA